MAGRFTSVLDVKFDAEDAKHPHREIERGIGRKFIRAALAGTGMTLTADEVRMLNVTDFGTQCAEWKQQ